MMEGAAASYCASVRNITQVYGATVALDDISLDIPGERMIGMRGRTRL